METSLTAAASPKNAERWLATMHGRASSRDRDVVERVQTARKCADRQPGSVPVRRDADTPFVCNGGVPGDDHAVARPRREYDVPEAVPVLDGDRTLPDGTSQDRDPDGSGRIDFVDPRDDRHAAGRDDDMRGPHRSDLSIQGDDAPATFGVRRDPEHLLVIAPLREDHGRMPAVVHGDGSGVRVTVRR